VRLRYRQISFILIEELNRKVIQSKIVLTKHIVMYHFKYFVNYLLSPSPRAEMDRRIINEYYYYYIIITYIICFRAFSVSAPKLWNELPLDIKCSPSIDTFKRNLKTYLFKNYFIDYSIQFNFLLLSF
jgi:hypothetical protein